MIEMLTRTSSSNPVVNSICPGPVRSDLAREFSDRGALQRGIINALFARTHNNTEVGTRPIVLAATVPPEDNGKFIQPYWSEAEYEKYRFLWRCRKHKGVLIVYRKSERNIRSETGKKLQVQVWKETLEVLRPELPASMSLKL
jgi:hypothetical protein